MMKKFVSLLLVVLLCFSLSACGNKQWVDTTYTYNRVIISLPNGEIVEGELQSWRDYEDGDQLQVCVDGVTYLVHSTDVALIKD